MGTSRRIETRQEKAKSVQERTGENFFNEREREMKKAWSKRKGERERETEKKRDRRERVSSFAGCLARF